MTDDRSNEPLTATHTFRGTTYTIRELTIGEFDDITEKATEKATVTIDGEEREIDRLNGAVQARLMISAAVTPKVKPAELGTRLFGGLNRAVNELHFSAEPEETPKDAPKGDEETKPGN